MGKLRLEQAWATSPVPAVKLIPALAYVLSTSEEADLGLSAVAPWVPEAHSTGNFSLFRSLPSPLCSASDSFYAYCFLISMVLPGYWGPSPCINNPEMAPGLGPHATLRHSQTMQAVPPRPKPVAPSRPCAHQPCAHRSLPLPPQQTT